MKGIRIGNNIWIAANVSVLDGVSIGDGAVIGAGNVVTKDIPEGWLAFGNPAGKQVRKTPEPICSKVFRNPKNYQLKRKETVTRCLDKRTSCGETAFRKR